jgi:hypothetical protein
MYGTKNSWLFEHFCWLLDYIERAVGLAPEKPTPTTTSAGFVVQPFPRNELQPGDSITTLSSTDMSSDDAMILAHGKAEQWLGRSGSMDTSKLVVGQEVFVVSGIYYFDGKVVKVTQEGVEVELARNPLPGDNVVRRFDIEGKACDGFGTAEYGPYVIDDMPFEERKAELVQAKRRRELLHKKYPDGSVIPADQPMAPIFAGPFWY